MLVGFQEYLFHAITNNIQKTLKSKVNILSISYE